jgi:outer membrane protein TolC
VYFVSSNHFSLMKIILAASFVLMACWSSSQVRPKLAVDSIKVRDMDSLIKDRLVALAMENPSLREADAMIGESQYQIKKAKSAWLNSLALSGNINEFVVNNSTINGIPASTLFPKYNLGVNIPFGIFATQDKNIARQRKKINEALKDQKIMSLRREVLTRYENYKEKKDLLDLQKIITDDQYATYQQKQREFANGEIRNVSDVNKEYAAWIQQRSQLRTREKDLADADLDVEEITGKKMAQVISDVVNTK